MRVKHQPQRPKKHWSFKYTNFWSFWKTLRQWNLHASLCFQDPSLSWCLSHWNTQTFVWIHTPTTSIGDPSPRAQQVPCKTHSFADLMFFLLIPDVLLLVESFTLLQCTEHTTFITLCFVLQLCNSSRSLNYIYSLKTSKSVICLIRSVNLLPNQELPFWFVIMTKWFSCRCHSGWLYLNSSSKPSSTANWHAKCCLYSFGGQRRISKQQSTTTKCP